MQVLESDRAEYQAILAELNRTSGTDPCRRLRNRLLEVIRRYPKRSRFQAHQLLWLGKIISE